VTTAAEYRQYAKDCIESARTSVSEPIRAQFLELSRLWLRAAEIADERNVPHYQRAQRTNGPSPPAPGGPYEQSS
jgi:hypothetical protein